MLKEDTPKLTCKKLSFQYNALNNAILEVGSEINFVMSQKFFQGITLASAKKEM